MKTILVVSDNHRNQKTLEKILEHETYDLSIHLGDSELSRPWIMNNFDYAVCGNNELWTPLELKIEIEGIKMLLMHGHTRGISVFRIEKILKNLLHHLDVDMILYGHTHIFAFGEEGNKYWLCPGSTNLSRGPEGNGYAILKVNNTKVLSVVFKKV